LAGDKKRKTVFTSLGSYNSAYLGCNVPVGVKMSLVREPFLMIARAPVELAVINAIYERFPSLAEELPLFYGLLYKGDEFIGILTEDFSDGRRHEVREVFSPPHLAYPRHAPLELQKLFGEETDAIDLASMAFMVDGRRRLGDFDNLPMPSEFYESIRFPEIHGLMNRYVLRIDYDI
jgi:hypothetical protein